MIVLVKQEGSTFENKTKRKPDGVLNVEGFHAMKRSIMQET